MQDTNYAENASKISMAWLSGCMAPGLRVKRARC